MLTVNPYSYHDLSAQISQIDESVGRLRVFAESLKVPDGFDQTLARVRGILRGLKTEVEASPEYTRIDQRRINPQTSPDRHN